MFYLVLNLYDCLPRVKCGKTLDQLTTTLMRVPCYLNEEVSFHNIQRLQLSDGSYAIEGRELRRLI
jgi:hypothetical protein